VAIHGSVYATQRLQTTHQLIIYMAYSPEIAFHLPNSLKHECDTQVSPFQSLWELWWSEWILQTLTLRISFERWRGGMECFMCYVSPSVDVNAFFACQSGWQHSVLLQTTQFVRSPSRNCIKNCACSVEPGLTVSTPTKDPDYNDFSFGDVVYYLKVGTLSKDLNIILRGFF
jgi:hypothetical protein